MPDDLYPVTTLRTTDQKTSGVKCEECDTLVSFFTENGQLVAVNLYDRERHRHQPKQNTPAANRARIEAMRRDR